jgi:hypothetical protein
VIDQTKKRQMEESIQRAVAWHLGLRDVKVNAKVTRLEYWPGGEANLDVRIEVKP